MGVPRDSPMSRVPATSNGTPFDQQERSDLLSSAHHQPPPLLRVLRASVVIPVFLDPLPIRQKLIANRYPLISLLSRKDDRLRFSRPQNMRRMQRVMNVLGVQAVPDLRLVTRRRRMTQRGDMMQRGLMMHGRRMMQSGHMVKMSGVGHQQAAFKRFKKHARFSSWRFYRSDYKWPINPNLGQILSGIRPPSPKGNQPKKSPRPASVHQAHGR